MGQRLDQTIARFDQLLRALTGTPLQTTALQRPSPAKNIPESVLSSQEQRHIAGLMRVNYAGEICAQALYQGQAFTTRQYALKQHFQQAAGEEQDHLNWCQLRLQQLNSIPSRLNPLWYAGALTLGTLAGLAGDRWSLGFLAETEQQVTAHLGQHLQKLPRQDEKTRAILQQMCHDEQRHADDAYEQGAVPLPLALKYAMRWSAKVMTTVAYWV